MHINSRSARAYLYIAIACAAVACGVDDSGSPGDSATPVDSSAGVDATGEASADATTVETSLDATLDTSVDATVEASADATSDAIVDASIPDVAADSHPDVAADSHDEQASPPSDASSADGPVEAAACVYPPAPPSSAAVLQFHKNPSRDGVYVDPAFTPAAAAGVQLRVSAPLTGQVYAQPLYVPNGPNGREIFIAATEANHVTAIDGCGVQVWDRTYGGPAAYADLPCGNIYPTLGITGTPVIDADARIVYFDAMTQTGSGPAALRHMIHAVSLDDGSDQPGWPVDVQAVVPGFVSTNQNQRGALTLVGGVLYVPYGGHNGDCARYYGWIVGVPVSTPTSVTAWRTIGGNPWDAGAASFSGAGFWAAGGLPTDGTHIFAVSGNTNPAADGGMSTTWVGSEGVFRLGAAPTFSGQPSDYFYPSNWLSYDYADDDLGGAGSVLFSMNGSQYLLTMDKIGMVYLLDPANLGGKDGAVLTYSLQQTGPSLEIVGVPVVYTTAQGTYVAVPQRNGYNGLPSTEFLLLSGNPPQATQSVFRTGYGGAVATTPDGSSEFIVWSSQQTSDVAGALYAQDGTTGKVLVSVPTPDSAHYFNPPIAANGRIVAAMCGSCFGPPGELVPPPGNGQLLFFY